MAKTIAHLIHTYTHTQYAIAIAIAIEDTGTEAYGMGWLRLVGSWKL